MTKRRTIQYEDGRVSGGYFIVHLQLIIPASVGEVVAVEKIVRVESRLCGWVRKETVFILEDN